MEQKTKLLLAEDDENLACYCGNISLPKALTHSSIPMVKPLTKGL
jgi:hypothetical protein